MARPAGVSDRNDFAQVGAVGAPRHAACAVSSSATARDTLVLCMWLWAPIALPVIMPYWPSVTSTRHSGTPMP